MTATAKSEQNRQSSDDPSLIDELIHAVDSGGVKERLRILQRVTDLFVAGSHRYSGDQIALFDDVLQQLAADIEVEARAKLADRLADVRYAPPKLVRTLAFDNVIEVARPVLIRSEQLTDDDLVENARTKSQEHLLAIAQRLKLSEAVTDVLVERGNTAVLRKVTGNGGAALSEDSFARLITEAKNDKPLAQLVKTREDIPEELKPFVSVMLP